MSDSSDMRRDIEAEARRLFPGAVRRVEWLRVTFEDDRGYHSGGMIQALDDEHGPRGYDRDEQAGRRIPVTVRLGAAELETVDRLITTGVAASRAE